MSLLFLQGGQHQIEIIMKDQAKLFFLIFILPIHWISQIGAYFCHSNELDETNEGGMIGEEMLHYI
jgi:hypothetical protein